MAYSSAAGLDAMHDAVIAAEDRYYSLEFVSNQAEFDFSAAQAAGNEYFSLASAYDLALAEFNQAANIYGVTPDGYINAPASVDSSSQPMSPVSASGGSSDPQLTDAATAQPSQSAGGNDTLSGSSASSSSDTETSVADQLMNAIISGGSKAIDAIDQYIIQPLFNGPDGYKYTVYPVGGFDGVLVPLDEQSMHSLHPDPGAIVSESGSAGGVGYGISGGFSVENGFQYTIGPTFSPPAGLSGSGAVVVTNDVNGLANGLAIQGGAEGVVIVVGLDDNGNPNGALGLGFGTPGVSAGIGINPDNVSSGTNGTSALQYNSVNDTLNWGDHSVNLHDVIPNIYNIPDNIGLDLL